MRHATPNAYSNGIMLRSKATELALDELTMARKRRNEMGEYIMTEELLQTCYWKRFTAIVTEECFPYTTLGLDSASIR